jgi:hypothetical protein
MRQRLSGNVAACPLQMRWLNAGSDLSRPNHIHQRSDQALMRFKQPPNASYTLHTSRAAYIKGTLY